jgi:uncharacterized protein with PQ loop repeat
MTKGTLGLRYASKMKKAEKDFVNKIIYVVAIAGPLMTIPQILKIFLEKNAAGVSLTTWSAYIVLGFFWLSYGIMHKEKPIIITNTLWIIIEVIIVMGIIMY